MAKKKRRRKKHIPPPLPPADPGKIWVHTKEGAYQRRIRGTVKPAILNTSLAKNVKSMKITSPAAKRIVAALDPFLRGLATGRLTARLSGKLVKSINQTGSINLSFLKGFEFQKDHPLNQLLLSAPSIKQSKKELTMSISIREHTLKFYNYLVTGYYFEAILLYGDPTKNKGLKIKEDISALFPYKPPMSPTTSADKESTCVLSLPLPESKYSWIAMLKVNCLEGREMAANPKLYGMKVVETGGGL